jgi:hypothetical protein
MGIRSASSVRIVRGIPDGTSAPLLTNPIPGIAPEPGKFDAQLRINRRPVLIENLNAQANTIPDYLDHLLKKIHPALSFAVDNLVRGSDIADGWIAGTIVSSGAKRLGITLPLLIDEIDDYHDIVFLEQLLNNLNPKLGVWELGYAAMGSRSGYQGYVAAVGYPPAEELLAQPGLMNLANFLQDELDEES